MVVLSALALIYIVMLLLSGTARMMARSLAMHPWSMVVHGAAEAFPTARWSGFFRVLGSLLAWCFAGMVLLVFTAFVVTVEIVFSPRDLYCSLRRRFFPSH